MHLWSIKFQFLLAPFTLKPQTTQLIHTSQTYTPRSPIRRVTLPNSHPAITFVNSRQIASLLFRVFQPWSTYDSIFVKPPTHPIPWNSSMITSVYSFTFLFALKLIKIPTPSPVMVLNIKGWELFIKLDPRFKACKPFNHITQNSYCIEEAQKLQRFSNALSNCDNGMHMNLKAKRNPQINGTVDERLNIQGFYLPLMWRKVRSESTDWGIQVTWTNYKLILDSSRSN